MQKDNTGSAGRHARARCRTTFVDGQDLRKFFGIPASPVANPAMVGALNPETRPVLHPPVVAVAKPGELDIEDAVTRPEIVAGFDLVQAVAAHADQQGHRAPSLCVWIGELSSYSQTSLPPGLVDRGALDRVMEDRDRFAGFRSAVNIRMAHADPENALDAAKVSDECFALVTRAYLKHSGLDLLPDRIVGETAILWYRLQQGFRRDISNRTTRHLVDCCQRLAIMRCFHPENWTEQVDQAN